MDAHYIRYIIIVVVVLIIVVNVVRISGKSKSHHYVCPNCGEHFQVGFGKSFFTSHSFGGKSNVTCPKCHKTNMLEAIEGEK